MNFLLTEDLVAVDAFCGEGRISEAFSRGAKLDTPILKLIVYVDC